MDKNTKFKTISNQIPKRINNISTQICMSHSELQFLFHFYFISFVQKPGRGSRDHLQRCAGGSV